MKKFWGGQIGSEIRDFAIYLMLHYKFSLILHKIAAWDNI